MAAYVLWELADSWFERLVYRISIAYTWSLSWVWLNGFFSGIMDEVNGLPQEYMDRCLVYALDCGKFDYAMVDTGKTQEPLNYPIEPRARQMGEFLPEQPQDFIYLQTDTPSYHSTLGQLMMILWSSKHKSIKT